jgi:hypothetical protein
VQPARRHEGECHQRENQRSSSRMVPVRARGSFQRLQEPVAKDRPIADTGGGRCSAAFAAGAARLCRLGTRRLCRRDANQNERIRRGTMPRRKLRSSRTPGRP